MAPVKVLIIGNENIVPETFTLGRDYELELPDDNSITDRLKSFASSPDKIDIIFLDLSVNEDILKKFFKIIEKIPLPPPVFVVYDTSDFKTRAEVWKRPEVIGYSKKGSPETERDIEKIIREFHCRKQAESLVRQHIQIGSIEPIAPEEYEDFKFVSLTAGKMREFMVDFKDIWARNPVDDAGDTSQDPFMGIPVSKWLDYVHYKRNPPSDSILLDYWNEIRKEIHRAVENNKNDISKIQDLAVKDDKLLEKFEEIFCNESGVKREKIEHVLIEGETGTGKSLIADMIHRFSCGGKSSKKRGYIPKFEKVTCTNLPVNLLEGELFGFMRGSFSSAYETKPGKIMNAYHGVIFLDEIGDMDIQLQSKILTFLDNGRIEPTGWTDGPIYIPTRVVAATNKKLLLLSQKKEFREDLYYRFSHRITIPPLRERTEDIELLVDFILQNRSINPCVHGERLIKSISRAAIEKLKMHTFPGNFRELENTLLEAVKKANRLRSSVILREDILFHGPSLKQRDVVNILPKITESGTVKILLQWDTGWRHYYFIGGSFLEDRDIDLEGAVFHTMEKKAGIKKQHYTVKPIGNIFTTIQHSRNSAEKLFYHFHFFGISLHNADGWSVFNNKANYILISYDDAQKGEYQGKQISPKVKEVWDRLKEDIENLPEFINIQDKI